MENAFDSLKPKMNERTKTQINNNINKSEWTYEREFNKRACIHAWEADVQADVL
jgi:hypothetical protein